MSQIAVASATNLYFKKGEIMKRFLSIILAVALVLAIVIIPGAKADAANYPTVTARKAQYFGEVGVKSTACEYDVTLTYKYQKLVVKTYSLEGKEMTKATKSFYLTDKEVKAGGKKDTMTYTLHVISGTPGTTYKIVATMQYSTDGSTYYDAPNPQTTTFVLKSKETHSNEWYNGRWYNSDGSQTYDAVLVWMGGGNSWWVVDSKGWYPTSQWLKIDGSWYYFTASGYMDYSEYRDGCWLGADGKCSTTYTHGTWHSDANGWWYEDNGWYPTNQYLWIDGVQYWFNSSGYIQ